MIEAPVGRRQGRPIPGPGRLIPWRDLQAVRESPLAALGHIGERYGELVRYPVGLWTVYLVSRPDWIRHILQENHRNYIKATFQYRQLSLVAGQGLLSSDGDLWRRQRRLLQPAFHHQQLARISRQMTAATAGLVERWAGPAQAGATIDVDAEMMRLTLTIVGQALFGADLDDDADQLVAAVLTALDGVIARARTPLSLPLAVPTPANRRFRAALATIDAAAARLIADRRRTPRAESDLLALLLAARDAETGQPMSDRQLRDEIVTFIVAGHETVASALTWTWHLLGQAPAVTAQLTTELTTVLAGRPPTFDDLPRLPLVRQIVDEALRLYPPAWLITRRAVTEDWLDDYRLPPGALVVISPYQLHRRASLWPAPERFQPERFTPAASAERPRFSYLPFGGGPRICIGNSFALIEAQLIVATIAQHYRLHPVADRPVVVEPLVTLRPRHGLPMRLQPLATATPPPYSGLPLDWS